LFGKIGENQIILNFSITEKVISKLARFWSLQSKEKLRNYFLASFCSSI